MQLCSCWYFHCCCPLVESHPKPFPSHWTHNSTAGDFISEGSERPLSLGKFPCLTGACSTKSLHSLPLLDDPQMMIDWRGVQRSSPFDLRRGQFRWNMGYRDSQRISPELVSPETQSLSFIFLPSHSSLSLSVLKAPSTNPLDNNQFLRLCLWRIWQNPALWFIRVNIMWRSKCAYKEWAFYFCWMLCTTLIY